MAAAFVNFVKGMIWVLRDKRGMVHKQGEVIGSSLAIPLHRAVLVALEGSPSFAVCPEWCFA